MYPSIFDKQMYPLERVNQTYRTIFISEFHPIDCISFYSVQPPSRESLSIKESLLKIAMELKASHIPPPSSEVTESHRQRFNVLDPSLQKEVDANRLPTKASNLEELLHRKEEDQNRAISNIYCLHHTILGKYFSNPVVLFDPHSLPHPIDIQAVSVNSQVSSTLAYERVLAAFSEGEKTQSIPVCLACCSRILTYPQPEMN